MEKKIQPLEGEPEIETQRKNEKMDIQSKL